MLKWVVVFCSYISCACLPFAVFAMEEIPRGKVTEVLSYGRVEAIAKEKGISREFQVVNSWNPKGAGNLGTRNLAACHGKYYVNNIFPISGVCENIGGHECLQVCDAIYGDLVDKDRIAKKSELKELTAMEDYVACGRTFDGEESERLREFKQLVPDKMLEELRVQCNTFIGDLNKYLRVFNAGGIHCMTFPVKNPVATMKCLIRQFYDCAHSERILWYDLTRGGSVKLNPQLNFVTYFQMCGGCEEWWDWNSGTSAVCVLAIRPYNSGQPYSPSARHNLNLSQFIISSSPGVVFSSGGAAVSSGGLTSYSQPYASGLLAKTGSSSLTPGAKSLFESLGSSEQSRSSGSSSSSSTPSGRCFTFPQEKGGGGASSSFSSSLPAVAQKTSVPSGGGRGSSCSSSSSSPAPGVPTGVTRPSASQKQGESAYQLLLRERRKIADGKKKVAGDDD